MYVRLVLEQPSHAIIDNFSVLIFDSSQSITIHSVDDLEEWHIVKYLAGIYSRRPCVPMPKEFKTVGEPVHGWVHFTVPNLLESEVARSMLTFNVNGTSGTCYTNIDGAHVHPDPVSKGTMFKVPKP